MQSKVEKLENWKIAKLMREMWRQSEERLFQSIVKSLAKRNREKQAMLTDVEEEQKQDVICFNDITGKELPWHTVRKARELEQKYLQGRVICKSMSRTGDFDSDSARRICSPQG